MFGGRGRDGGQERRHGAWEVLQYQNATLTGTEQLPALEAPARPARHRGRHAAPVPAGARVVVLDADALTPLDTILDSRSLAQSLRYGPSLYAVSDRVLHGDHVQGAPVGLRPFSVSQIAGTRDPASGHLEEPSIWAVQWST